MQNQIVIEQRAEAHQLSLFEIDQLDSGSFRATYQKGADFRVISFSATMGL